MRTNSLPFSIGLFLFAIYLLSFSGKLHVMDELAVFTTGHNLGRYGRADINQLIWTNHWTPNPPGIWGDDGNLYSKKAPGISFITAPLIGLGHAIPGLNAVHVGLLTNALVTALIASLLLVWLVDLGFSRPAATLASLGYGLGTIAWVYARMFWESSILALAFLVAVWSIHRSVYLAQLQRGRFWLLACGIAVAIGLTLRFEAALIIVLIGLYLAAIQLVSGGAVNGQAGGSPNGLRNALRALRPTFHASPLIRSFTIFLAPSLFTGLGLLYFNFIRCGSPFKTGYSQEILFRQPWVGAFGLLFSPGRGLFIYAPFLLLLFFGLRSAWHRLPRLYFWLVAAICLCYWLFYGTWFAWGGMWGWGPRFLLPILPLLMPFVAEPLEWLCGQQESGLKSRLLWAGVVILVVLSLAINLLGITVDFNEHFLRLDANDDFVFNWATFPPLAHWRILQEGLVDLIWLRPTAEGLKIEWSVLLPALILSALAALNLIVSYAGQKDTTNKRLDRLPLPGNKITRRAPRFAVYVLAPVIALSLTFLMMTGTARISLANEQAQFDLAVLETLASSVQPGDALLVPMPPFGDVQEISTRLIAYLAPPLPTYAWIESEPRAIQPDERERVLRAVGAQAQRVWLFERWLTPNAPATVTAVRLNQEAFPIWEHWFAQSGRLTLYALAGSSRPYRPTVALNIPFQGGLTLVDFAIWNDKPAVESGGIVKLRLTWEAMATGELPPQVIPAGGIIVFAQLLDQATQVQNIVQNDRLLIDLQDFNRSPLRPGQTVRQGYGLQLPDDLAPGSYPLVVGLYHTTAGQRLLRADDSPDDFVYLTDIVVK